MGRFVRALSLLFALAALGRAQHEQCHSLAFAESAPPWADAAVVPRFDPSLGILTEVAVDLIATQGGEVRLEHLGARPATCEAFAVARVTLRRPDATVLVEARPSFTSSDELAAFDGFVDFVGPSGVTHGPFWGDQPETIALAGSADLALFTGAGTIALPLEAAGAGGTSCPGDALEAEQANGAFVHVCYRFALDCNGNGSPDGDDIATGVSLDADGNGVPDECQVDCNGNGVRDGDDIENGTSADCDGNGIPDECDPDCDGNGVPDGCEPDCDADGLPDDCEPDCDGDAIPDDCEGDCDGDGTPDACEPDWNGDGVPDPCECVARSYCSANPNSSGAPAAIAMEGSTSVRDNDVTLVAGPAPAGQPGLFYYGVARIEEPFGDGFRCVGGAVFRLPPVVVDPGGTAAYELDLSAPPAPEGELAPGSTWNFQFWFRDPAAGGSGFNLSDALSVIFCP